MILELADIRQRDAADCAAACVATCLQFHGQRFSYPSLVQSLNVSPYDGTDPRSVEAYLRSLGFRCISGEMTPDDLRHFARRSAPVICATAGHWVVSAGISRGRVRFQCPVNGRRSLRVPEFVDIWHDVDRHGTVYAKYGIAVWSD